MYGSMGIWSTFATGLSSILFPIQVKRLEWKGGVQTKTLETKEVKTQQKAFNFP